MRVRYLIGVNLVLLLSACAPAGPRAVELLPTVKTARVIEGNLSDFMQATYDGTVMLRAHPAETALLNIIDQERACYQQIDGVATQTYSDKRLPLMAGIVVVADLTTTDRAALDRCFTLSQQSIPSKPTYELCTEAYTTTLGTHEFYAAYVALPPNMCQILCAQLPNCTTPP
jgi:hypothetical protein